MTMLRSNEIFWVAAAPETEVAALGSQARVLGVVIDLAALEVVAEAPAVDP